jgi:hypothetical protein
MKTFLLSVFLVFLGVSSLKAQCLDKSLRVEAKEYLGEYVFESAASKPLYEFKNKKTIEAVFPLYAQEKYRVINLCSGFLEEPNFEIYDIDSNLIYASIYDEDYEGYFDFIAPKSGYFTIRFIISKKDIIRDMGCVCFAIGYK